MRAICTRDLRAWFSSGIGYFVITVALCVLNFAFYQYNIAGQSAHLGDLFAFMPVFLVGFVPLLTMQSFAGDFEQKTDRLYPSAHTGFMGIAIGKFLCCLAIFKGILAVGLLWPVIIMLLGGQPGLLAVAGGYLGVVFVGAAYISAGVFISSLTENKVIAAVGSLGVFLLVFLLETRVLAPHVATPAWLTAGLRFASVQARYDTILLGLLSPADILYFFSLCALFLFLTVQNLERRHLARGGHV